MSISSNEFVDAARSALMAMADPARAPAMRAYMKDQFDFLGIASPVRRAAIAALPAWKPDRATLLSAVSALWTLPGREYRYTAIDLLWKHRARLGVNDIAYLLDLAQVDAWWDSVDGLAKVVGGIMRTAAKTDPQAQMTMDAALTHASMWVRRIAMLHQLGWRLDTDERRLFHAARVLAHEKEFFIRKAIGWALRDYARWQPVAVKTFLLEQGATLSALTRREAGKHLPSIVVGAT